MASRRKDVHIFFFLSPQKKRKEMRENLWSIRFWVLILFRFPCNSSPVRGKRQEAQENEEIERFFLV
jgi:hypothetical protein